MVRVKVFPSKDKKTWEMPRKLKQNSVRPMVSLGKFFTHLHSQFHEDKHEVFLNLTAIHQLLIIWGVHKSNKLSRNVVGCSSLGIFKNGCILAKHKEERLPMYHKWSKALNRFDKLHKHCKYELV